MSPSQPLRYVKALYVAHTLLEFVLGAIKLRGKYAGFDIAACAPGAEKFARHHGVALLSLAALGEEVLRRRLCHSTTAEVISAALAVFHWGCVLVMLQAWSLHTLAMHLPFAIGFTWHAFI